MVWKITDTTWVDLSPPLNVSISIKHVRMCVMGATPMSNTLGTDRQIDRQSNNRICPVFVFFKTGM